MIELQKQGLLCGDKVSKIDFHEHSILGKKHWLSKLQYIQPRGFWNMLTWTYEDWQESHPMEVIDISYLLLMIIPEIFLFIS